MKDKEDTAYEGEEGSSVVKEINLSARTNYLFTTKTTENGHPNFARRMLIARLSLLNLLTFHVSLFTFHLSCFTFHPDRKVRICRCFEQTSVWQLTVWKNIWKLTFSNKNNKKIDFVRLTSVESSNLWSLFKVKLVFITIFQCLKIEIEIRKHRWEIVLNISIQVTDFKLQFNMQSSSFFQQKFQIY